MTLQKVAAGALRPAAAPQGGRAARCTTRCRPCQWGTHSATVTIEAQGHRSAAQQALLAELLSISMLYAPALLLLRRRYS
jgi:hypothetical protein